MSHNGRYREHRIPGSLERYLGRSPTDQAEIVRLAQSVYHGRRGVYFTEQQLEQMPWQSRQLILAEASRINGPRRRNG